MVYGRFKGLFTKPKPIEPTVAYQPEPPMIVEAPSQTPEVTETLQEPSNQQGRIMACKLAIESVLEKYGCSLLVAGQFEGDSIKTELKIIAQPMQ